MFNLGWTEVVIVGVVAMLIFGPKKIPELGGTFGKTLRGFKEGITQSEKEPNEDDLDADP
ncbi:Sec-independent protein translocase subunit TatA/TatB [Myxacorys almedinensis]|uniref:Sec-independent protein translocase protein TatA n=1 Tax=Myxacorys almedinensis A TaxID=2690445 RepID=A0A8J7Z173_9CYAN|nr:twin-arginine translocase TatA/TatE family subunit [Myxacorys almedinensis]NDJ15881.1 twin-arginine translocase TatA/TatE family subunit [Myxacorys almedinensis A]